MNKIKDVRFVGWVLLVFVLAIAFLSARDILAQPPAQTPPTPTPGPSIVLHERVKCERITDTYRAVNPLGTGLLNVWVTTRYGTLEDIKFFKNSTGTIIYIGEHNAILSPLNPDRNAFRFRPTIKAEDCQQEEHPEAVILQIQDRNGNSITPGPQPPNLQTNPIQKPGRY